MTATPLKSEVPRRTQYEALLPQLKALLDDPQATQTAQIANLIAALHRPLGLLWTGIYEAQTDTHLSLGVFQGPVACMSIPYGKGVCGTAWAQKKSIIVPDVHAFEGHIACSSEAASEMVIPLFVKGRLYGVLDMDSTQKDFFRPLDYAYIVQALGYLRPPFTAAPLVQAVS